MRKVGAKKKVKVLIGTNDMLLAGVQRLVIDQLRLLDRNMFDVHLVVLMRFPGKGTFDYLIPPDVPVHQLSFSGFVDIGQWVRLITVINSIRPDVVKTATFFSNTIFLLLKLFFGYVVVAAEHNTVNRKPLWQRIVDRILLPRAFTVVADSKMVAEFVSETEGIKREHFTVIYNGVDIDAVSLAEKTYGPQRRIIRAKYKIPENAYVVFTAARLVGQKNHLLMIKAFSFLCAKRKDTYLLIAGEGALRKKLEALIGDLGMDDRIILLGEQKNIHQFYAVSDCFLLTSRHEGFCIAALEGLAFGLPLISTRVAGVSEYLNDGINGFFVDPIPEDIAKKLNKVIEFSDDTRERFGAEGKKTAGEYSVLRYGEAYKALFKRCVRRDKKA